MKVPKYTDAHKYRFYKTSAETNVKATFARIRRQMKEKK